MLIRIVRNLAKEWNEHEVLLKMLDLSSCFLAARGYVGLNNYQGCRSFEVAQHCLWHISTVYFLLYFLKLAYMFGNIPC